MSKVSELIEQVGQGDTAASDALLPLVYQELKALAASKMRDERNGHTLTPTALVHEAWLRLAGSETPNQWSGKGHFFAAAAEAMRRILIDHARRKKAVKRGGNGQQLELVESWLVDASGRCELSELVELDESLKRLEKIDPDSASIVKLRYFVGMTSKQAAEAIDCSPRKADMLWAYAKSWLKRDLASD